MGFFSPYILGLSFLCLEARLLLEVLIAQRLCLQILALPPSGSSPQTSNWTRFILSLDYTHHPLCPGTWLIELCLLLHIIIVVD